MQPVLLKSQWYALYVSLYSYESMNRVLVVFAPNPALCLWHAVQVQFIDALHQN